MVLPSVLPPPSPKVGSGNSPNSSRPERPKVSITTDYPYHGMANDSYASESTRLDTPTRFPDTGPQLYPYHPQNPTGNNEAAVSPEPRFSHTHTHTHAYPYYASEGRFGHMSMGSHVGLNDTFSQYDHRGFRSPAGQRGLGDMEPHDAPTPRSFQNPGRSLGISRNNPPILDSGSGTASSIPEILPKPTVSITSDYVPLGDRRRAADAHGHGIRKRDLMAKLGCTNEPLYDTMAAEALYDLPPIGVSRNSTNNEMDSEPTATATTQNPHFGDFSEETLEARMDRARRMEMALINEIIALNSEGDGEKDAHTDSETTTVPTSPQPAGQEVGVILADCNPEQSRESTPAPVPEAMELSEVGSVAGPESTANAGETGGDENIQHNDNDDEKAEEGDISSDGGGTSFEQWDETSDWDPAYEPESDHYDLTSEISYTSTTPRTPAGDEEEEGPYPLTPADIISIKSATVTFIPADVFMGLPPVTEVLDRLSKEEIISILSSHLDLPSINATQETTTTKVPRIILPSWESFMPLCIHLNRKMTDKHKTEVKEFDVLSSLQEDDIDDLLDVLRVTLAKLKTEEIYKILIEPSFNDPVPVLMELYGAAVARGQDRHDEYGFGLQSKTWWESLEGGLEVFDEDW
ncbi:hypothetical protein BDV12DRAFT_200657 [Aspergillus spectabilis]